MAIVDSYLWFLHLDRRMSLDVDLGPLHIHLYGRAVFLMWVTVAILAAAGIAVLISRKPELIQKWRTWVLIAPVVGLPVWLGQGTTAALAATLAVVAVIEYARLVGLGRADTFVLVALAVLYPLAAWLRPSLLQLAPIVLLLCALPSILEGDVENGRKANSFHRIRIGVDLLVAVASRDDMARNISAVLRRRGHRCRRLVRRKGVAPHGLGAQATVPVEPQQDRRRDGRRDHRGVRDPHVAWAP